MKRFNFLAHKIMNWEYWPMPLVYYPIFPVWFYYALKARSFFFFNAANPSIKNGGMALESKKEIYDLIPARYFPRTVLIQGQRITKNILKECEVMNIKFPMIAKPDIGMKSFAVERITDINELDTYIKKMPYDFLIQELIEYPNEIGIFYVRYPNEKHGRITGIVSKEFLSVVGNGTHTLLQLIAENPRGYFQLASLKKKYDSFLETILPKNEVFILVPFGSHTRGAKFIDITNRLNEDLLNTISGVCEQVEGFYFGRLDIRYSSFEELSKGEKFSIIEINGAGSEPTHIYDPKHSLFFAWKEIIRHWKLLYEISSMNYKKGFPYLSFTDGRKMLRANRLLEAELKLI